LTTVKMDYQHCYKTTVPSKYPNVEHLLPNFVNNTPTSAMLASPKSGRNPMDLRHLRDSDYLPAVTCAAQFSC